MSSERRKIVLPQLLFTFLLLLWPLASAYSIDQASCSEVAVKPDLTADRIGDAVEEAKNIARYAAFRMDTSSGVPPGDIVEALIGSDKRQTFVGQFAGRVQ